MNQATALLEDEVRELVRRRGLNPARDVVGIRTLVADAIADYDDRSVAGLVPPVVDREQTAKDLLDAIAGLGPLQRFLDDPTIEEVWINEPGKVFVARSGRPELMVVGSIASVRVWTAARTREAVPWTSSLTPWLSASGSWSDQAAM